MTEGISSSEDSHEDSSFTARQEVVIKERAPGPDGSGPPYASGGGSSERLRSQQMISDLGGIILALTRGGASHNKPNKRYLKGDESG